MVLNNIMKKAILIIDHGSRRQEANDMLREVARMIQDQADGEVVVRHAHMELAEPSIAEGIGHCVQAGAEEIIVHPYMLSPGRHAMEDIPRLVEEAAARYPGLRYRLTEPLGIDPLLGEVVLARCGLKERFK